jgi:thiamine-phosphate pyrophosphorylase
MQPNKEGRQGLKNNLGQLPGLYMITVETANRTHLSVAEAALIGGATTIQYRDKTSNSRVMMEQALAIRELTKKHNALFIVNDRIDIAMAAGADGVHLGQNDIDIDTARRIMGNNYIMGISATNYDEAIVAANKGADYVGVGPVFPTASKGDAAEPIGIEGLSKIRKSLSIPIVAIGGITVDNSGDVVRAGADAIAVISAVASANNMTEATMRLLESISLAKG